MQETFIANLFNPLSGIIVLSFIVYGLLLIIPNTLHKVGLRVALYGSFFLSLAVCALIPSLLLELSVNNTARVFCLTFPEISFFDFSIHLTFGVDSLSLLFLFITVVTFPFAILLLDQHMFGLLGMLRHLILIEVLLILTFTCLDLFLFAVLFESLIVPLMLIIIKYGANDRRVRALTYFFMYTMFGSFFLLLALFMVYSEVGSTDIRVFENYRFTVGMATEIFLLLFIVFAIKVPAFPFYIWLPEAHVEAPTVGSVILAGLMLKLGGYGILRFLSPLNEAKEVVLPWVFAICVISTLLAAINACSQTDMKRTIAYSSIVHMCLGVMGFVSNNVNGILSGLLMSVSHGFISPALFYAVGIIYDRHHTREFGNYGGMVQFMPLYAIYLFLLFLANISFPGTAAFLAEILLFDALNVSMPWEFFIFAVVVGFFGLVFMIMLMNRVLFGNVKAWLYNKLVDMNAREWAVAIPFVVLNTLLGIFPNTFILIATSAAVLSAQTNTEALKLEGVSEAEQHLINLVTQGKLTLWGYMILSSGTEEEKVQRILGDKAGFPADIIEDFKMQYEMYQEFNPGAKSRWLDIVRDFFLP